METPISEGMPFLDIPLYDTEGKPVHLRQFLGKNVILYFYPKDDTPGCTREACNFRDSIEAFIQNNAVILGVSLDSSESHRKFREKHKLPFPLLTDRNKALSTALGLYGRNALFGLMKAVERATFIINKQGNIHKIFRRVQVEGHSDDVLRILPHS